jgi:hypothetical protein
MVRLLAFLAQIPILIGAALFGAFAARRPTTLRSPDWAVYWALALNPLLLSHATESLTDFLSAALVFVGWASSLPPPLDSGRSSGWREEGRAILAFLAVGCAAAIRPANIAVAFALGVCWVLKGRMFGRPRARVWLVAVASLALPLVPQVLINARQHRQFSPLVVGDLYLEARYYGLRNLKYAGVVIPGEGERLFYENPFYTPSAPTWRQFALTHPARCAATLALHAFALVDYDFPFTYITQWRPWYRWPLRLSVDLFVFVAAISLSRALRRWLAGNRRSRRDFGTIAAAIVTLCLVAVYLLSSIETRYSLPLFFIWTPAVVNAARHAIGFLRRRPAARAWKTALMSALLLAVCAGLSTWLSAQAPRLRPAPPMEPSPTEESLGMAGSMSDLV